MLSERQHNPSGLAVAIGKLQRQMPLPEGTYWIDVIDTDNQQAFSDWVQSAQSTVKLLATEHFDAVRWPDCPITEGECSPSRDWHKFEVIHPTVWDAVKFGYPNIIAVGEKVETSADTTSEPDFGDNCDIACQAEKVAQAIGIVSGCIALIMVLKAVSK